MAVERERNERAVRLANDALALREVSQQELGGHWEALAPAERDTFVGLLRRLFEEVAYPKSSSLFGDPEIEYRGERAAVETLVSHPTEGRIAIDYQLRLRDGRWVTHDILLDDVILALAFRSQVQKILREESYARLLERLEEG